LDQDSGSHRRPGHARDKRAPLLFFFYLILDAKGISADGLTIVGLGLNPDGNKEAYIVNLSTIPIPASLWLFGSGLLGLIGVARKKSS
jgi:hypothetical protein